MNNNFLFRKAIKNGSEIINYQTIRWLKPRKPFWLGLAKSKMFVIREPKSIFTPEESKTNFLLRLKYNTEYKSMLNFICKEDPRLKVYSGLNDDGNIKVNEDLEEKISMSLKVNEEWNAESKKLGEIWTEKTLAEEEKKALELLENEEKMKQSRLEMVEEIVRKEKILSECYITPENIDEAIDKCLASVAEYNFAIDLEGNKYPGREPLKKVRNETRTKKVQF